MGLIAQQFAFQLPGADKGKLQGPVRRQLFKIQPTPVGSGSADSGFHFFVVQFAVGQFQGFDQSFHELLLKIPACKCGKIVYNSR